VVTKSPKSKSKAKLFKQWKAYLSDSRLSNEEVIRRAKNFTKKGMKPNE
jgi:hypothetical protein